MGDVRMESLGFTPLTHTAGRDLTIRTTLTGDGLAGGATYDTDVLDECTVRAILSRFHEVLRTVIGESAENDGRTQSRQD